MEDIKVMTWNLLSTELVEPDYHFMCNPLHLTTEYRWPLIRTRLQTYMQTDTILCLQELSDVWISKLLVLFEFHNYCFVYNSRWLGTGIAFPRALYKLNHVQITCIGETIMANLTELAPPTLSMFAKMWQFVRSLFATTTLPPPKKDAWQMAAGRKNCVLQTRLVDKQENLFSVFNYHMPCMFRDPDVMNIHARTLLQVCNKQAEAEPFILCGDFNAQPASDVLKILKGRAIELPKSTKFKIAPVLPCEPRLRCAHEQLGHMPPFTNFSHTKHSETEFKGVIDYIFISNEFDIVDVSQQPASDAAGTFPNAVEPSDHIDLSATARLISKP